MRRQHYLKRNARVELPQYMVFVDTETKGVQINERLEHQHLWFGWAKFIRSRESGSKSSKAERWIRFQTAYDFWRWVHDNAFPRTRIWVFAHNWNFDAGILNTSEVLPRLGYTCIKYINDKPPVIIDWRNGSVTLHLVDTLNYFAGSLESIGESIGISKLAFPDSDDSSETWDIYCKRDVEVMEKAVLSFRELVQEQELGNFQSTLASQAFTAYRHRFMHHDIHIHDRERVCKLEREAYYGGRTEVFRVGDIGERIWYVDINSMYPYVMHRHEYPCKLAGERSRPSIETVQDLLERYCVIADCYIETDKPIFPKRIDGRLCFPIGRFRATLSTPEIKRGIHDGCISHVSKLVWYEKAELFKDFVDTMYSLRMRYKEEGNPAFTYMVKILMNSLYGKFGQNGKNWVDTGEEHEAFSGIIYEQEREDLPVRKMRYRLGVLQELQREGESDNSFPAISGHVTAYGRMYLWELIEKARRDNVFYTDTDSLMVNERGFTNLLADMDEKTLGRLKVEQVSDSVQLYSPKDYSFGETHKRKGIRKSAVLVDNDTWEQDMFRSWDFLLSQRKDGYIPIERVQKTLSRSYKKGTVTETGNVIPFELREW